MQGFTSSDNSSVGQWFKIGPHRLRFEPPDVLYMYFEGSVDVAHFHEFYALATTLIPQNPIYIVRDTHGGGLLNAKTRSAVINTVDPTRVAAIISYGSSFQLRVIVTMLLKAMRTFKRSAPQAIFVDSEEEARAWIAANRPIATTR